MEQPEEPQQDGARSLQVSDVPAEDATPLRACWQFASVVQFCRLFGAILKIKPFSADLLERAVLHPARHNVFLSELATRLLRANVQQAPSEAELGGWHEELKRRMACNWPVSFESNLLERDNFTEVPPVTRAIIMYALCDWRIHDCPLIKEAIRTRAEAAESTGDLLRSEPVGKDSEGALYFYFSREGHEDCRIYKERPPRVGADAGTPPANGSDPQAGHARWQTVTTTLEGVHRLADSLAGSQHEDELALHKLLVTDLIPALEASEPARRRAEEQAALLEAAPSKRSGRLAEVQKKRGEEEQLRKEEEERRQKEGEEAEMQRKEQERAQRAQRRQEEEERRRVQALEEQRKISGLSALPQPSRDERAQRRAQGEEAGSTPATSAGAGSDGGGRKRPRSHAPTAGAPEAVASNAAAGATQLTSSGRPVRSARRRKPVDDDDSNEDLEAVPPVKKRGGVKAPPAFARISSGGRPASAPARAQPAPFVQLPLILDRPTPADLYCPRARRSRTPRQPRMSRAAFTRLRQAAAGTLPLDGAKSLALRAASPILDGGSASAGEPHLSSEYSESSDGEAGPRQRRAGKQHGASHQEQRRPGSGPGGQQQAMAAQQSQRDQLLAQLAHAPPHQRQALLQYMQQHQQAQRPGGMGMGATGAGGAPMFSALSREQQAQFATSLMSRLTPQQRHALQQMPPAQQLQQLQVMYQQVQAVQAQAAQQAQLMAAQQEAEQRAQLQAVLSSLSPAAQAQLAAMPPAQQQAAITQLLQQQAVAMQKQRMAALCQTLAVQAAAQGGPMPGSGHFGGGGAPGFDAAGFAGLAGQAQRQPGHVPMDLFGDGGGHPRPPAQLGRTDEVEALQDAVKMFLGE